MGGLLLFEGEELFVRFRPHPAAYLRRYLSAFLWLVPAALAAYWPELVGGARAVEWGLAIFIGIVLVAAFVAWKMFKRPAAFAWFAVLVAAALILARLLDWLPGGYPPWFLAALLGAFLTTARALVHEADRIARVHFLTSERLVVRGGLRSRHERAIAVKKLQEVRSERPLFGRFFDFGDLVLVESRTMRGGKDPKLHEQTETLRGIGRLTEVQHHVQQLIHEARLPEKERRRRHEERRVKDSMRRLASWMRRGNQPPLA